MPPRKGMCVAPTRGAGQQWYRHCRVPCVPIARSRPPRLIYVSAAISTSSGEIGTPAKRARLRRATDAKALSPVVRERQRATAQGVGLASRWLALLLMRVVDAPVSGDAVVRVESWCSLWADLLHVDMVLLAREGLAQDPRNLFARRALWDGAVIAYGRTV